jgi:hypothetical protein
MGSVVVRDPEIMSGEPTFRGTQVLVRGFPEGFPTVHREMALQALEGAEESLLASR